MPSQRVLLAVALVVGPQIPSSAAGPPCLSSEPAWVAEGAGDFGRRVAAAGDVDGDGFADWLVASPDPIGPQGHVYLYRGGPEGLSAAPALVRSGRLAPIAAPHVQGARLAAYAGDVDADGRPDLVSVRTVGGEDAVFVGSAAGRTRELSIVGFVGVTGVLGAGDVDGDGFSDVLVTGTGLGDRARVAVFLGSPDGAGPDAAWTLTGMGRRAAAVGDVDGDGADDILLGLHGESLGFRPGAALFLGIPR